MWATTTRLTTGRNGAGSRPIPRPAPRSWSRSGRPIKEVIVPVVVQAEPAGTAIPVADDKPLFTGRSDGELLGYGVPAEWVNDVKQATEDTLLALTDHLPAEAAEALLELATGGKPRVPQPATVATNPFDHPDAQRRFRVMTNVEELQRALDFPWEKWTVFLHPEQRQWVERDYAGPARVSGSAGTGKTIVALHRAAHLARTHPEARVLLTTFSDTLANALHTKLRRLLGNEPRLAERIDVHSLNAIGLRLYKAHVGPGDNRQPRDRPRAAARSGECRGRPQVQPAFSPHGVGAGGGCLAAGELGGVSRCRAPRQEDAAPGGAARGVVVHLRARSRRTEGAEADHARRAVQLTGSRDCEEQERGLRLRGRGRGAGHQRRPSSVPCCLGRRSAQRSLLRRRPGPADLPAALLMEVPRRRHSGAFPHVAGQLPHLPPDSHARRTACSARS